MKKILVIFAALMASFSVAVTANAAPPTAQASISVNETNLNFGDSVTFTTTIPKIKGSLYPMVVIHCFQDVNGDGLNMNTLTGEIVNPDLVFSWLDFPGTTFWLGANGYIGNSLWAIRGGGEAECRAGVYAYGHQGGYWHSDLLGPEVYFHVDA